MRSDVCLALAESRAGLGKSEGVRELLVRCRDSDAPALVRERAEALLERLGDAAP